MPLYNSGIALSKGFRMDVAEPSDTKYWADDIQARNDTPLKYPFLQVSVLHNPADVRTGKLYFLLPKSLCDLTEFAWGYADTHWQPVGGAGQDGNTPVKGIDYDDGKDGITPIKDIDYFDGPPGPRGDPFNIDLRIVLSEREFYDQMPEGFTVLTIDTGNIYIKQSDAIGDWGSPISFVGDRGWSPTYTVVTADETQELLAENPLALYTVYKVSGYVGGQGAPPPDQVGKYVGGNGYVDTIAEATKILRVKGPINTIVNQTQDGDLNRILTFADGMQVTIYRGPPGSQGQSVYGYQGFADDDQGNGYATTPAGKTHLAIRLSINVISPLNASHFAGLWMSLGSGGGVALNDNQASALTTYSSQKIEQLLSAFASVERSVSDVTARNNLADKKDGENVYVQDATGDSTVLSGWAVYKWNQASSTWLKLFEQEGLDVDFSVYARKLTGEIEIDYTPADSDNTSGFFATLLTAGKIKLKAALDRIVSTAKTLRSNFDTHNTDNIRHVTGLERTDWNSRATGNHTHDEYANLESTVAINRYDTGLLGEITPATTTWWQAISIHSRKLANAFYKSGSFTSGNLVKTNATGEAVDAGINGQAVNWMQDATTYAPNGTEMPVNLTTQDWSNGIISVAKAIQAQQAYSDSHLYFGVSGSGISGQGDLRRVEYARIAFTAIINVGPYTIDFRKFATAVITINHNNSAFPALTYTTSAATYLNGGHYTLVLSNTNSGYSTDFDTTRFKNAIGFSGIQKWAYFFQAINDGVSLVLVCISQYRLS